MEYLAEFFLSNRHVCGANSKLLLPAFHHCKQEEHLLHPLSSSTNIFFQSEIHQAMIMRSVIIF